MTARNYIFLFGSVTVIAKVSFRSAMKLASNFGARVFETTQRKRINLAFFFRLNSLNLDQ
jgi:hypothetical protein